MNPCLRMARIFVALAVILLAHSVWAQSSGLPSSTRATIHGNGADVVPCRLHGLGDLLGCGGWRQ